MLFNSFVFLHFFLPIFLVLYFAIDHRKTQNIILLLFSLLFYAWGEGVVVGILLLSAVIDYNAAKLIDKGHKRVGLWLSILFNLGILFYFKYVNFFIENINTGLGMELALLDVALPIGISFFTFQTMSYTIDVYRGEVKASDDFLSFATYVAMFPQLIAGPIVRYAQVEHDLAHRNTTWSQVAKGIERFIIGFAKKMILANYFALIADDVFHSSIAELHFLDAWLGIFAYTLQIFFDFSAYSDMAIGLGLMLGFTFPENFNYPYISKSIKEFWRRWHMTMSTWFRDYVYISLGGNRVSRSRVYVNLFVVFMVTGLWHGASWNFIVWGLLHGAVIVLERLFPVFFEKLPTGIRWIYTILVVMLAWVFFKTVYLEEALLYISRMFTFDVELVSFLRIYHIDMKFMLFTGIALVLCTPIAWTKVIAPAKHALPRFRYGYYILLGMVFMLSLFYLSSSTYDPFIYFRF